MIDDKNDPEEHVDLQKNVMKEFKLMSKKLDKMVKSSKSNVRDIIKNRNSHSNNAAHVTNLNTRGAQRIERLEKMMNKMQNRITSFVNGTDEEMFETKHFDELM